MSLKPEDRAYSRMTGEMMVAFREKMGWNRRQSALNIGISPVTHALYENGARHGGRKVRIPTTVALACAALIADLKPIGDPGGAQLLQAKHESVFDV